MDTNRTSKDFKRSIYVELFATGNCEAFRAERSKY